MNAEEAKKQAELVSAGIFTPYKKCLENIEKAAKRGEFYTKCGVDMRPCEIGSLEQKGFKVEYMRNLVGSPWTGPVPDYKVSWE